MMMNIMMMNIMMMNIMMMNIMMTHNHRLGTECLNIEYKMNIVQKQHKYLLVPYSLNFELLCQC